MGCGQLRNDNHMQLSQPPPPHPTRTSSSATPPQRASGALQWGITRRKRNCREQLLLLLFRGVQGLKTLPNSPSNCKVKQLSKPPKEKQELRTADPSSLGLDSPLPNTSRPVPCSAASSGEGRVNRQSALADSSGSKVQSQSEPPRRNCKSQGSI